MALLRVRLLSFALLASLFIPLWAQEGDVAPELVSKPPVAIIFTPPDLDGCIVLGVFDAAGKLRRTLRFESGAPELKIDTNGYIAQWDGLDEAGRPCVGGRYSARGYVVGGSVDVEGEAFHFNDWMAEDQIPAEDVKLCRWPDALGVELKTAKGSRFARIQNDGTLAAAMAPMNLGNSRMVPPPLLPEPLGWAEGREGTAWLILNFDGQHAIIQLGKDNASLRQLRVLRDEPQPVEILAALQEDVILLKEEGKDGLQRVRMLRRGQTASEKNGRVVADWEVIFERTLQPCAKFGVVDGRLVADAGAESQADSLTLPLIENALEPGIRHQLRFQATAKHPGSVLVSPEGLVLVEISTLGDWSRFLLSGDGDGATLYQGDGIVVEEFAIRGLNHVAAFDAGVFLLALAAQ